MYTVEFQKRGLPHAHILLWLSGSSKLITTQDIDRLISAELPDPSRYPRLAEAVKNYMIHGPCGKEKHKSPCMVKNMCSKWRNLTRDKQRNLKFSFVGSLRMIMNRGLRILPLVEFFSFHEQLEIRLWITNKSRANHHHLWSRALTV
jgi:hypothetical protein